MIIYKLYQILPPTDLELNLQPDIKMTAQRNSRLKIEMTNLN